MQRKKCETRARALFQFDDVVLEAALYLLESAELAPQARSNPVRIARCMSAMVR